MPLQCRILLACLQIPQFGCMIHGASSHETLVWIESYGNHFILMSREGMQQLSSFSFPKLGSGVETPCDNLVSRL